MSFMELDLNIRMSENPLALNKSDAGEEVVVVREESKITKIGRASCRERV